jgi:deazaflavin-dependent oxidoreductase (nitroreductase family)
VGRHSGEPRTTPLAWFPDGEDAWLVVGSGGGDLHPDWFANLVAHPDRTAVELPGKPTVPVTPRRLEGAEREDAWRRITDAQPRLGKYQAKSNRTYPVIRLSASAT